MLLIMLAFVWFILLFVIDDVTEFVNPIEAPRSLVVAVAVVVVVVAAAAVMLD